MNCDLESIGASGDERRPYLKRCRKCGYTIRSKYADPKMTHARCQWRGTPEQKAFAIARNIAAGGCKTCGCHPRVMKSGAKS